MNETVDEIASLRRDVDDLRRATSSAAASAPAAAAPPRWYAQSSLWFSLIALLFSFGTTWVSYRKADAQDIQSARQELRGLLQRMAALPKENLEAAKKYAGDPAAALLVGGFINQENAMLAREAAEIARRLPRDVVSPTEFYALAVALQNAYELAGAKDFLKMSLATAANRGDFNSEIGALRMLGNLGFLTGKPDDGRVDYQRARAIFARYPDFDPYTRTSTNVWTELSWASSEASVRANDGVRQHLATAESLLADLPPSPGLDRLRAQVRQATDQFTAMGVVPLPAVPALVAPSSPE